jgi:Predicted Zn-ribbon RNA-binding protein with a function in translation
MTRLSDAVGGWPVADAIDDRRRLSKQMNAVMDGVLEPGERVLVAIPGLSGTGIAGTDRRAFIWKPLSKPWALRWYQYWGLSRAVSGTGVAHAIQLFGAGLDDRKPTLLNIDHHTAAIMCALTFRAADEQAAVRRLNELIAASVTNANAAYGDEQERIQQALPARLAEQAAIVCVECAAGVAVASRSTEFTCTGCGSGYLLRRCPSCSKPGLCPASLAGKPLKCPKCGQSFAYAAWDRRPVSAGAYASNYPLAQDKVADADRRAVRGLVWAATGLPGLTRGMACHLEFDVSRVIVTDLAAVSTGSSGVVASIPWSEVRTLEVSGAGAITRSTGGGVIGGGFGAKGFVEGALVATAINALTRRTSTTIETFVALNAGSRELMLLNTLLTPDILRVRLAPAFARLNAAREGAPRSHAVTAASQPDRLTRLKMLGDLRDSRVLDDDEFESEKARILASE